MPDLDMLSAISHNDLRRVMHLVRSGVSVNSHGRDGITALGVASATSTTTAQYLIDKGANVNANDIWGGTPLQSAADTNHLEIAALLLHRGAHVNAKDVSGSTALSGASAYGHAEMIRLLARSGARIDGQNNQGTSALMEAARHNHRDCVRVLLAFRANRHLKDKEGKRAIDMTRHKDIIRLLSE